MKKPVTEKLSDEVNQQQDLGKNHILPPSKNISEPSDIVFEARQSGKVYAGVSKALGLQRTTSIIHKWRTVVNRPTFLLWSQKSPEQLKTKRPQLGSVFLIQHLERDWNKCQKVFFPVMGEALCAIKKRSVTLINQNQRAAWKGGTAGEGTCFIL